VNARELKGPCQGHNDSVSVKDFIHQVFILILQNGNNTESYATPELFLTLICK